MVPLPLHRLQLFLAGDVPCHHMVKVQIFYLHYGLYFESFSGSIRLAHRFFDRLLRGDTNLF